MSFMTKIENTQDTNLAMNTGNHNFTVIKNNLITDTEIKIPDYVAIINQNTNEYLGTVGKGWEPVQPHVLYELADELIKSTKGAINGVFTMYGGSVIGILFNLAEREYISGDKVELNFLMLTSFNGMYGITGNATTYRIVSDSSCNTSNKVYNLRHTKNVHNRLEVVKNMLKYYQNEIASFDETMTTMVESHMNDNAAVAWFKSLFPTPNSERTENILNNQVNLFVDCLHNGNGSNIVGVRGTCYGAFQALTEYINHHRSTRIHNDREEDEVRFQAVHFGSGNQLIQKGLHTIGEGFLQFSEKEFMIE